MIRPLFQNNDGAFYCGDCREVLPHVGPVDTVITDPVWPNAPSDMFPNVDDPESLLSETLSLIDCKRVVIVLRHDSDPRFLQAVPKRWPFFRVQILPYVMPGYIGRKLGGDELAYCFGEPLPSAPGRRVIPGYAPKAQPNKRKNNGHPCSRTLVHFKWLVHWWSLPGKTVLDPFAGSGTTCVAAIETGRKYIGIEVHEEWARIAEREIEHANIPLPFQGETTPETQIDMAI